MVRILPLMRPQNLGLALGPDSGSAALSVPIR